MSGAANALGALYAASDGMSYATLQNALALCHDVTAVHPSRWELRRITAEEGFRLVIEALHQRAGTQRPPTRAPIECVCRMPYGPEDGRIAYDHGCPIHRVEGGCPGCGAASMYFTASAIGNTLTQFTCTLCGNKWTPTRPAQVDDEDADE